MAKTVITRYELPGILPKGDKPLRIALAADFHDRGNEDIIEMIKAEKPDLIFIAGDLMERHEEGEIMEDGTPSPWTVDKMEEWMSTSGFMLRLTRLIKALDGSLPGQRGRRNHSKWDRENGYRFLREAAAAAPVYYSIGNHEWYHTPEDAKLFRELGVCRLDNRDTIIPGTGIRIGGLSTRFDREWLREYSKKEGTKLLLMHHPDYYDRYVSETDRFDLILCGHVHGGQWRFLGRGIFAPGQGFFPKYHHGLYPTNHSRKTGRGGMLLTAGCANTVNIPRFGNPCELVMLELS